MTATRRTQLERLALWILGPLVAALISILTWLGSSAYARLDTLETVVAERGASLAAIAATLAAIDARTARIERVLDDRLPRRPITPQELK